MRLKITIILLALIGATTCDPTPAEMQEILANYNRDAQPFCHTAVNAEWESNVDIEDDDKLRESEEAAIAYSKFILEKFEEHFKGVDPHQYEQSIQRQLQQLQNIGTNILSDTDLEEFTRLVSEMVQIYSTASICPFDNQDCAEDYEGRWDLTPQIEERLANSKNYEELEYVWKEWHAQSGAKMRDQYKAYVELNNKAAVLNGFEHAGKMWQEAFEDAYLEQHLEEWWTQIEPLYSELQTFVRHNLRQRYPEQLKVGDRLIPAHLFGNMWAQDWTALYEDFRPFKNISAIDVTSAMREQGYTPLKMFEMSDEFYQSLGLPSSEMCYGEKAMIEKPPERKVLCHASAWDFCDGEDFRVKQCTEVTMGDFVTVHHEMGHIMYYLLYKDQPLTLRTGATPAFHEAVGDAIALSVSTPKHLQTIGLLDNFDDTLADNINALFHMALERLSFMPFGYLVDKWRWDVFSGDVPETEWNAHWWKLREKYQKVAAPVARSEEHFDPGAKFHVPNDYQYISYFKAHILQFQMYKALCIDAGEYDPEDPEKPLHKCDFYNSHEAGERLRQGLSLGANELPPKVLEVLTGEDKFNPSAMVEYFKPLYDYLKVENQKLNEEEMKEILERFDGEASLMCNRVVKAQWDFFTDLESEEKQQELSKAILEAAEFSRENYEKYFEGLKPEDFEDELVQRQIMQVNSLGVSALDEEKLTELTTVKNRMASTYGQAKVCPYEQPECADEDKLNLEPDLYEIIAKSTKYDELSYYWNEWRKVSGREIFNDYEQYVNLVNEAAHLNEKSDYGEMWREAYEDPDLEANVEKMWRQVEPLYDELHYYVKSQLATVYTEVNQRNKLLPAHILGNMWAQNWVNLYENVKPYKNVTDVDITEKMIELGYTVEKIFEVSDQFYTDLGLEGMEMSYTGESIIIKPEGREIQCHASAWDFCDGSDYRVKMCTTVNQEDFVVVHHELGHIQYFILYKDLPMVLRSGANPGFHEAVGDTIVLSVNTPKHLHKLGFLEEYDPSWENDINALFKMALERVAFLPFGYLIDKWRWDVFSEKVKKEEWNDHWWKLVAQYQKLEPPVDREEGDFDPGAKYHIPGDSQYINYFLSYMLQFQMHKALCLEAGEYDPNDPEKPLHRCDIDQSKAAGAKLRAGLEPGLSQHWSESLKSLTGETEITGDAILEYFAPLYEFLKNQNSVLREAEMVEILEEYSVESSEMSNKLSLSSWDVQTDVGNPEKQEIYSQRILESAAFTKEKFEEHFKGVEYEGWTDEDVKRQLTFLTNLGVRILEEEQLKELTDAKLRMQEVYNMAKICPYEKPECDLDKEGWSLDPEITEFMAASTNYDELKHVWTEWHNKFGDPVRRDYRTYVDISNKAARANGFMDYGEMWRSSYEDEHFVEKIDKLWSEVEPLYTEMLQYVTGKLRNLYGDQLMRDEVNNLIPAHVFGNMWAQSWSGLFDRTQPFDAPSIDVTDAMNEQGYTALKMFELSDEFFVGLGLESNAMSYGEKAIIEKPEGVVIVCHASAWDFSDGEDFRIKMCTKIDNSDFITVHHEMGHIQYFILYKDHPAVYRTGANPGFHEAVGDTIALSVSTPSHLKKLGLLSEDYQENHQTDINALYKMALDKVAFLPFGYVIDKWRWEVFSGDIPEYEWTKKWWEYRAKYQKITPPARRTEEYFDPAAKYHIPADSQYIAYFIAHILQFQMHRSLCIAAGQYDPETRSPPLYKCDIDGSKEAGKLLRAGLALGRSKHWSEALEAMTGEKDISATALLEYFEPLYEFLKQENNPQDKTSQMIPIIVGSVIGGVLVITLIAYFVIRSRRSTEVPVQRLE